MDKERCEDSMQMISKTRREATAFERRRDRDLSIPNLLGVYERSSLDVDIDTIEEAFRLDDFVVGDGFVASMLNQGLAIDIDRDAQPSSPSQPACGVQPAKSQDWLQATRDPLIVEWSRKALMPESNSRQPLIFELSQKALMPESLAGYGLLTWNQLARLDAESSSRDDQSGMCKDNGGPLTGSNPPSEKRPAVPLGLRLLAALKLLQEAFRHPLTTSYIIMDPERNTITVERNADASTGIQKRHR